MGEAADDERLAELNRNKERYEQMEAERSEGKERELSDEVRENRRRLDLQKQREAEEARQREEAKRKQQQQKDEVEASASRIAAGRAKYRAEKAKQDAEVEASAKRIAEGRAKYREEQQKKEIEASAERIAEGRMKYRVKREAEQEEDKYRKTTPVKSQILDTMFGRDRNKNKPPVKPISTLGGSVAYKTKKRLGEAKQHFMADLAHPAKSIEAGRETRRQRNAKLVDPFMQAAPPRMKRSRRSDASPPVHRGTGFLFTEGFANPPVTRRGRKKKGSTRRGWLL